MSYRISYCQVSISSTFYVQIFRTNVVLAAFSICTIVHVTRGKVPKKNKKFARKLIVDEIDTWVVNLKFVFRLYRKCQKQDRKFQSFETFFSAKMALVDKLNRFVK